MCYRLYFDCVSKNKSIPAALDTAEDIALASGQHASSRAVFADQTPLDETMLAIPIHYD